MGSGHRRHLLKVVALLHHRCDGVLVLGSPLEGAFTMFLIDWMYSALASLGR